MNNKTPDRATYGISRKLSDGKYGSVSLHASYSSDAGVGETNYELSMRVSAFVESFMKMKIGETQNRLWKEGRNESPIQGNARRE